MLLVLLVLVLCLLLSILLLVCCGFVHTDAHCLFFRQISDIPIFSKRGKKGDSSVVPRVSGDAFASDDEEDDVEDGDENPLLVKRDDVPLSKKVILTINK